MLKRTKQIVLAVAEQAGVIAPRMIDATEAADTHRKALTDAQAALESAEAALQAAHDRGAETAEVTRLEAALAAAKVVLSRAEARYIGAEKHLAAARSAEGEKVKEAARVAMDEAHATRKRAALRMDAAAQELAEAVAEFDGAASAIAEAQRVGVAGQGVSVPAQRLVEHALERAGALPSRWVGDPAGQPTAAELAAKDEASTRAGV